MLGSDLILKEIVARNFSTWSGVPCSILGDFINFTSQSKKLNYISASNEGEAVAVNSGLFLGNSKGISVFQNSGLGNAINPLSSLVAINKLQAPLIMSLRGNHLGYKDEPQHEIMGKISKSLLEDIGYSCYVLDGSENDTETFHEFLSVLELSYSLPALLIHRKSLLSVSSRNNSIEERAVISEIGLQGDYKNLPKLSSRTSVKPELSRSDVIETLCQSLNEKDVVVATTGFTSRELSAICDRDRNFYMVGAMGCAGAVGLGLALAQPDIRVYVLDGDGAALMRLGTFSTIGKLSPKNLIHVLLNNNQHESTGGQALSMSNNFSFVDLAQISGYSFSDQVSTKSDLLDVLNTAAKIGLSFISIPILPGTIQDLPRPTLSPVENTLRIKASLAI